MGRNRSPILNNKAFTLIELIVALAMAMIFIMATLTLADMSIQTYGTQERVVDAQQSVRAALDLMVRDIRMAGYDPTAMTDGPTMGIGIITATDTILQFSADLNADRADNGGAENLTYFFDIAGKRLRQKEGGQAYPQTFIENVVALEFTYFNVNGDRTADPDDVAAVAVTLTVEYKSSKGRPSHRTLTTSINCRNLWF